MSTQKPLSLSDELYKLCIREGVHYSKANRIVARFCGLLSRPIWPVVEEKKQTPSEIDRIKQYRAEHKCSLKEAIDAVTKPIDPTKRQALPAIK